MGKLLEEAAKSSRGKIVPRMKQLNKHFNSSYFFVCDGWVDASKRHILGSIVALLNLWFAYDEALGKGNLIQDDQHDGVATAEQIEKPWKKTEEDFNIALVVWPLMTPVNAHVPREYKPLDFLTCILGSATRIR